MENDELVFKILPTNKTYISRDKQKENQIKTLIIEDVIPAMKEEYLEVKVRIIRKKDGNHAYLIAYMARKETLTLDVVKIEIDEDYKVLKIQHDYDDKGIYD